MQAIKILSNEIYVGCAEFSAGGIMAIRAAINGFGRIGRMVYRAAFGKKEVEIVAINDLTDSKTLAHLLKWDSTYGKFDHNIEYGEGFISVEGKKMKVTAEKEPEKLPWKELDIDVVIESTGAFTSKDKASKHLTAGAKKVIVSAPAKGADITIVMGVNSDKYDPKKDNVISTASCTTNCLAPVCKVLLDNFGIKRGFMTTVHAYTNDQRILDFPHKDLRRARSAGLSIIPTTTGAASAIGLVIPELTGKLDGFAMRVPVPTVSVVDLTVETEKKTTKEEVNAAMKKASETNLKGILGYTEEPLVSADFRGDARSSIFDALSTMVISDNLVKVISWYDNEWGYANRMVDMMELVAKKH